LAATLLRGLRQLLCVGNLPGKNSLAGRAHPMHLLAKMLLKLSCLKAQEYAAAHRSDHVATGERRLIERDTPRSPSHGRDLHPASTPESESELPWEAPPVLGAVRDENTSAPLSP